jgi:hypothetical protein
MLLLYLPIIIFEAMFEAKENKREAGEVHGDLNSSPIEAEPSDPECKFADKSVLAPVKVNLPL